MLRGVILDDVPRASQPSTKCSTWRCCGARRRVRQGPGRTLNEVQHLAVLRAAGDLALVHCGGSSLNEVQHLAVLRGCWGVGGGGSQPHPQRSAAPGGAAGRSDHRHRRAARRPSTKCSTWRCCGFPDPATSAARTSLNEVQHLAVLRVRVDVQAVAGHEPSTKCSTWRCCGSHRGRPAGVVRAPSTKCSTWRCCGAYSRNVTSDRGTPQRSAAPGGAAGSAP